MPRGVIAVAMAFALTGAAQAADPPPAAQAVIQTYIVYCLPMAIKGASRAEAEESAKHLGYTQAELSSFPALAVRTAPAWRVPSASGVVTVALGGVNEKLPSSCEITVSGHDSEPLRAALDQAVICEGCPFTRNPMMSSNTPAAKIEKYDWKIEGTRMLVSVLSVALPDESKGASFFVHVHRLP
jgi:hypothetical protein